MSKLPEVVLIAAVARNGVIGRDNALPWRLKADLAHFKAHTSGHPIIMGRKTWASLGRALPNRRNLVVTRHPGFVAPGAEVVASPEAALAAVAGAPKVFVIGGGELYRAFIDDADCLLITEVRAEVAGDSYFPEIDPQCFEQTRRVPHKADADNEYGFEFVEYRRRA